MSTTSKLTIKQSPHTAPYTIYKITISQFVYIGHTKDLVDRAKRHATDTRRTLGKLFRDLNCEMVVEHIAAAHTEDQAREVERKHIIDAAFEHGRNLLNIQHARCKSWIVDIDVV